MKKIIFLFALLFGFASCQKENVEPNPQPTNGGPTTYTKFVVTHESGFSIDSIKFVNTTAGTSETATITEYTITCNGTTDKVAEMSLSNSPVLDDVCSVTLYHSNFTFGNMPISDFLANSSTDLCEATGGNSGNQLSSGSTTTFNFTVE